MAEKDKPMDVTKPGKSAPDATARPVIVGHKPMVQQDPMVKDGKDDIDPEIKTAEEKVAETPHTEKVIEPPKGAEQPAKTEEETKPTETPEETSTPEEPVSDDSAVVDAVAEQAGAKKKDAELSEEEKKKQEAIAKLIEEKTYFVPIKVASKKRNARWSVVILVLLLLLVGAYLAADAGVISVPFKLPIRIIKSV